MAESTTTPTQAPEPGGFTDSLQDKLEAAFKTADAQLMASQSPPAESETPAAPAAPSEATTPTGFTVPAAVTQAVSGVTPEKPAESSNSAPATFDEAAEDKRLTDLFASNAGQAFKAIKEEAKTSRAQIAALKAELEAARSAKPTASPEELARLKTEADALRETNSKYENELRIVKIQATQEYQENVQAPIDAMTAEVSKLSTKYGLKDADLVAAITNPDPAARDQALSDIAEQMRPLDQHALAGMVDRFNTLLARRQQVHANSAAALKLVEENRAKAVSELQQRDANEHVAGQDRAWAGLQEKVPLLRKVEGQDAWNSDLDKMAAFARSVDARKLDPVSRAELTFQGAALPLVLRVTEHYAKEVVRLQNELSAARGLKPGAGAGGSNVQSGGKGNATQGLSFTEAMARAGDL